MQWDGPTIEMYCASYRDNHPSKYLECGNITSNGYRVRWNGGSWDVWLSEVESDYNQIYIKTSTNKAESMWLASTSADGNTSFIYARSNGTINTVTHNAAATGLRPIVCLKSDVELEKLDDGTYQIIKTPKDAADVASTPWAFYGAEVTNYEAPHAGVDKWRIFYADESNVYLIADDYITGENAPKGKNGNMMVQNGSMYKLSFNFIYDDYEGASWIIQNSKASKWLNQFLTSYGTSTNINIRAVAYMMDTNIWSAYYAGDDAEYAMGGPTIEMYCASYKDTHRNKYIEYSVTDSDGYSLKWSTSNTYQDSIRELAEDEFNSIYVKSDFSRATSMWIASPSADLYSYLISIIYYGELGPAMHTASGGPGLRPLVCLKPSVQLEKQSDGTFKIVK